MKHLLKKAFLLLALVGGASNAWAGTAIISPTNMTSQSSGTDGSTTGGNVWYGNGTNIATGFHVQITGNLGKALGDQGTVKINSTSVKSFKNSNGAQNTITLPSGSYASSVTFYVTANDNSDAKLSECNGTSYNDAVTSHKDGDHPTIITKTLGNVNSFTFTFSTKQVFFAAVVTYDQPTITTQPVSATYQKDEASSALTVAATASTGELSYQWYSCDDANKTNAASLGGATNASYTPSTSANGIFYYFCRITDGKGSTDSEVATITVSEATAPTISAAASESSVFINAAVTLTATVTGVPEPTIQWYSCDDELKTNPVSIDGATNITYAPSTSATGTYYYYAVATNSVSSSSSNVVTLTVNPLYTVTYSLGEVTGTEGTVPAVVEVETSLTIPVNKTLYKDGNTLTAWNDGTADHAIGSSFGITANTTLTPVFTANGASTYLGHNTAEVTWDFQTKNGAPTIELEGAGQTGILVTQATIGANTMDVKLDIDATSGKFNNANNNDWAQTTSGTKLTVPVLTGAIVQLYVYQEGTTAVTFDGNDGTYSSNIYSYTATSDGDLTIVIKDQGYSRYLKVTYPSETAVLTVSANDTKVGLTKTNITDVDYLTVSPTDKWTSNKTYATDYTGQFFNMSNGRVLTIKVTGAKTFEVFVRNDGDATRSYKLKVGDADDVVVNCASSSLKASGIYALDPAATTSITLTGNGDSVYPVYFHFNPTVPVTITEAGWATLYTDKALDFSGTGLTAYTATCSESVVTLTPVDNVPANTGVVLKGAAKDYDIPVIASSSTDKGNLRGSATAATAYNAFDGFTLYVLTSVNEGANVQFNPVTSGSIAAGKAYLKIAGGASSARSMEVVFADDILTGINEAEAATEAIVKEGKFFENGKLVIFKKGMKFNANGARLY